MSKKFDAALLAAILRNSQREPSYIDPDFYNYAASKGYASQLRPDYGDRVDGTHKGLGWLGVLPMANGQIMTEQSVGAEVNGREIEMPSIVPGLSQAEIRYLQLGGDPRRHPAIMRKAVAHALMRDSGGLSPFKD